MVDYARGEKMKSEYKRIKYKKGKEFEWFKKNLHLYLLSDIYDYVDLFLKSYGGKYNKYLNDFIKMSKSLGFNISRKEIEEIIFKKLVEGDNKNYKLKGRLRKIT